MNSRLFIAVLALSSFAVAQRGGGRPAGAGGGAGKGSGAGAGASMGSMHSSGMGTTHASSASAASASGKTSSEILSRNTKLSSNLDKLLPQGTTAQQACNGFKNLGQCVAAIHVSHNLDIPFAALKSKVTGSSAVSLGKAIGGFKPDADAKAETKKAQKQTDADLTPGS